MISSYSIVGGNEESRFRLHETKGQENVVGTLGNSGKCKYLQILLNEHLNYIVVGIIGILFQN